MLQPNSCWGMGGGVTKKQQNNDEEVIAKIALLTKNPHKGSLAKKPSWLEFGQSEDGRAGFQRTDWKPRSESRDGI